MRKSEVASKIVDALAKGPRFSHDLADETGNEVTYIRRLCAEPKFMGVVERVTPGYRLTKKGIQLWKEFHVTKATELTASRTPPTGRKETRTSPVHPAPRVTLLTDDENGP